MTQIQKKLYVLSILCVCIMISGCGGYDNGNNGRDAFGSDKSQNITDNKKSSVNEHETIEIHVSDWMEDDYLDKRYTDYVALKKDITISSGRDYFALYSNDGHTGILPIPDGKSKITYSGNEDEAPPEFEIGAIFEMEDPKNVGLEINLGDIKNEYKSYDSGYINTTDYIETSVTESSKKDFMLFYEIVNSEDKIIDYGFRFIDNGEGKIFEWITPLKIEDYSIRISGVYMAGEKAINTVKINGDYEWLKSDSLDGYYEAQQDIVCNVDNSYGVGVAKEIVNGEYKEDRFFCIYNSLGNIGFSYDTENEPGSDQQLPKYSYEIKEFSNDCIDSDLYSIEYEEPITPKPQNTYQENEKEKTTDRSLDSALGWDLDSFLYLFDHYLDDDEELKLIQIEEGVNVYQITKNGIGLPIAVLASPSEDGNVHLFSISTLDDYFSYTNDMDLFRGYLTKAIFVGDNNVTAEDVVDIINNTQNNKGEIYRLNGVNYVCENVGIGLSFMITDLDKKPGF